MTTPISEHAARLRRIAHGIATGANREAERELGELLASVEHDGDPRAIGYCVFAAALARRLSRAAAEEANLYLNRFDVPQIHLFNLLANEVPQVGLTTIMANGCIARAIAGHPHPVVIDVGIGTGRQMTSLLELLRQSGQLPARLTLIGIEPSDWSLDLAEKNVRSAAVDLGIELSFHRFCNVAEGLTRDDWHRLGELCRTRPAINASFALHHVSDVGGRDVRDDVLLRLRSLNPAALVLSEPNVHHLERDFLLRFENCVHHFETTFSVIDALSISQTDKDALKVCFFGREIADILGNAEETRSERHESTTSWLGRLARTGYAPSLEIELPPSGPVIRVTRRDGYATLDSGEEPLVAVLCATPLDAPCDVGGALARAPSDAASRGRIAPMDIGFYLAALGAVARADAAVHAHETAFIMEQARIFGMDASAWQTSSLDEVLARADKVSRSTREVVVRDLIFLARLDDDYDARERSAIATISDRLGLSAGDLARLEEQALLPPVLAGGSSWFRELWFLGIK